MQSARTQVLVVDDEHLVLETIADLVESLGFETRAESDPHAALDILANDPGIALLITDVRMPCMTGVELAERAQTLRPDLKIVLASGYTQMQTVSLPLLSKPFALGELANVLAEAGFGDETLSHGSVQPAVA